MKTNSKIIILILVIAIITVVVVAGLMWWQGSQKQLQKYTGSIEKATVAVYRGEFSSLVFLAQSKGFFKDNGLNITLSEFDTGTGPLEELLKGNADFSTSADFACVSKSFENKNLRILSTIDLTNAIEIIAKKDSGISKPQDLKNKKIGLVTNSQAQFSLGEFLISNNMRYGDVDVIGYSKASEVQENFINESLDAVAIWDPFTYNFKKKLGENAISWNAQTSPTFFSVITRNDVIEKNPELVRRFVQSLADAEEYVKQNNAEARAIVRDRLGYEDSYIRGVWDKNKFNMQLSQGLILALEEEARWAIANKLTTITEVPNYLDYIYLDALERVKPEAVTIIH